MTILRQLFGPSQEGIWRQLAEQIGGDYEDRGFWRGGQVVRAHVGEWTVSLDTYAVHTGTVTMLYTRLRAPFVNADSFRFQVAREGFFWKVGKVLGARDVEVGIEEFDRDFVIRGNDESRLRSLFADEKVRALLQAQPEVHFEVKDDEGWFGTHFPDGVDELCFEAHGVVKDVNRLRGLFDLFAATLNRLCEIGSAYQSTPGVAL